MVGLMAVGSTGPSAVAKEQERSLAGLDTWLKPGTHVDVVDSRGRIVRGEFVRVDADGIMVAPFRATEARRVAAAEVVTVTRHGDSLKNGALIGLGVGILTAIAVATDHNGDYGCDMRTTGCKAALSVFSVGSAVGFGVLLDQDEKGREVVYRAPADKVSWSVAPHPMRQGAGVRFALRF